MAHPPLGEARALNMNDIDIPRAVSTLILQNARAVQEALANWEPPEGVEVINIAGVGQLTPVAFRYTILPEYAVEHTTKTQDLVSQILHIKQWRFVVEPLLSYQGDKTVPLASAVAVPSSKELVVDLSKYDTLFFKFTHDKLLDAPKIVSIVATLIKPKEAGEDLLTQPPGQAPVKTARLVGIHSPLRPAGLSEGENDWWLQTSSVPIWRLGGSTYIALEPGESIELFATGEGGATLSFSPVDGDPQKPPTLLTHIPVASSTRGALTLATTSATLSWDYDGDGFFETKQEINTNSPSTVSFRARGPDLPLLPIGKRSPARRWRAIWWRC